MRKLPVYLLLDCSGSMSGEPIASVERGVHALLADLRSDPMAAEVASLSIITFSSTAQQVVPLSELASFVAPPLQASGATALGDALRLLMRCVDREVSRQTSDTKGDFKPLVFLMTDGQPTDDWKSAAEEVRARRWNIIACAVGSDADDGVLKQITDSVVRLTDCDAGSLKSYFMWVSASIASPLRVGIDFGTSHSTIANLPPPPAGISIVPDSQPDTPSSSPPLVLQTGQVQNAGLYGKAEEAARRTLEDSERALGAAHPKAIGAIAELARILEAQGKVDQAEPLYRHSIQVAERVHGPDHPAIAESLSALAGLLTARGDYAAAEELFRRAVSISQQVSAHSTEAGERGIHPAGQCEDQDSVDCTLYAPSEVVNGTCFLVQVYVHLLTKADEAQAMAHEFDPDSRRRGFTSLGAQMARGTTLTLELSLPGLVVAPSLHRLVWRGRTEYVQYSVSVPADRPPSDLLGNLLVSQESIPIGQIIFKLRIVSAIVHADRSPKAAGCATRYTLAFISYASNDRPEVLRRVQMLPAVGIRYFQDVLDLDPGDRWAQELFRHIDESDVMFLFWSSAAKASEWVTREWQYGLERKGDAYIRPVVIEGPPPPEPPPQLKHLHFGDRALYFIRPTEPKTEHREQGAALDGDSAALHPRQ